MWSYINIWKHCTVWYSVVLSCVFLMYFLSFSTSQIKNLSLPPSSLSEFVLKVGGTGLPLSGRAEVVGTPALWDPSYHLPCWWVAGGKHPILSADFLFSFSWGHSAGWPHPFSLACLPLSCVFISSLPLSFAMRGPKTQLKCTVHTEYKEHPTDAELVWT